MNKDVFYHDIEMITSKNFIKILEVDLNEGTFLGVKIPANEEPQTIYIKEWVEDFANMNIYSDDRESFLSFFDFDELKKTIATIGYKRVFYRRYFTNGWRYVSMELIPMENYTEEDAIAILYVHDIDTYIEEWRAKNHEVIDKLFTAFRPADEDEQSIIQRYIESISKPIGYFMEGIYENL